VVAAGPTLPGEASHGARKRASSADGEKRRVPYTAVLSSSTRQDPI
jgi:hypothetical protein